jgi:hypothetical protein
MASQPFSKLLQCYVLNAIDALPPENRSILVAMEPKLRATYHCDGSWDQIVASQMDFPATLNDQIRELWRSNRERAQNAGHDLQPLEFVDLFLRQNFPYALE